MKRVLSIKQKTAYQTMGSIKSAYHRGFSRGLALGLVLLAAFIVLTGSLLYGEESDDALYIDPNGNVGIGTNQLHPDVKLTVEGKIHVQDLKATRTVQANEFSGSGSELTVEDGENIKKALNKKLDKAGGHITGKLSISGNVGIGTSDQEVTLEVAQNQVIKIGNAYLSSGGDYAHLANNEWFDGKKWHGKKSGTLIQLDQQKIRFHRHDGKGNHTPSMIINSKGYVSIGGAEPIVPMHISRATTAAFGFPGTSSNKWGLFVEAHACAKYWHRHSDARVKRSPLPVKTANALNTIQNLKVYDYGFIPEYDDSPNRKERGFLAQQVKEVIPEAVSVIGDKELSNGKVLKNFHVLNESRIVAETVAAVQELHKVIMAQQEEIARLREEVAGTRAQMAQFEDLLQKDGLIVTANGKR